MGVKRKVEGATARVVSKIKQTGFGRRLTTPGSGGSLRSRGVEFIYLLVLFLLSGGVVNAASNAGVPGINLSPIVGNPSVQNITETFIVLFAYIVGALGAYALYLSGRQTIRARSAEMFFVGGIALIAIAMTIGYYVLSVK